ncbi:MAG: EamA family transporter [Thermoguttaceae bacterium]|nr:EamA family transporter [Thermoguttaceae bacterium]MDW8077617.1 EamA family transporter [Thermoguttaceae bacterium]
MVIGSSLLRHPRWQGRLLVVLAALMWSTSGLFVKAAPVFAVWPENTRGILLAFWRAVFASAVLIPLIRRPQWHRELVPLGVAFLTMNICYLSAMVLGTAANAIWLQYTAPAWVFIFAGLLFGERPVRADLFALAFAVLGVGLILLCEFAGGWDWSKGSQWGTLLGVASGLAYALVLVYMRRLCHLDAAWLVALNHLLVVVCLLPVVVLWGIYPNMLQVVVSAAFGAFQMGIPYLVIFYALTRVPSQEAVLIGLIEPVVMPLWVYLAWGEVPAWWTLAGGAIILVGLVLRYTLFERQGSCQQA